MFVHRLKFNASTSYRQWVCFECFESSWKPHRRLALSPMIASHASLRAQHVTTSLYVMMSSRTGYSELNYSVPLMPLFGFILFVSQSGDSDQCGTIESRGPRGVLSRQGILTCVEPNYSYSIPPTLLLLLGMTVLFVSFREQEASLEPRVFN
ncbi:hypothetical protein OG21DRAFT_92988 [Imleria badia]|nr:hypothetical protein OG21DRAFT_92988 [Imleria badia]